MPFFARHLPAARVTCLDVSRKSLDVGAAQHGDAAEFAHFDGRTIPFDDGTFDVALASCVFHHIPHDEHVALLAEIRRVLTPGGRLFVFEHNPLNPLTRHAVNTCEFDEHAKLVLAPTMRRRARDAGFAAADVRYRIFFPHALRRLRPLEASLTWLPLGAQYYVVARKAVAHAHLALRRRAADPSAARLLADRHARVRVSRRLRALCARSASGPAG